MYRILFKDDILLNSNHFNAQKQVSVMGLFALPYFRPKEACIQKPKPEFGINEIMRQDANGLLHAHTHQSYET